MARIQFNSTIANAINGDIILAATITIRKKSDDTLATLYLLESGGSTTANPALITNGEFHCWIDEGTYTVLTDATTSGFPLESEVVELLSANGALNTTINLGVETTARIAADTTLGTQISTEATTRFNADATLTNNLASEISNRANADASHAALTASVHGIPDTSKLAKFASTNPVNTVISAIDGAATPSVNPIGPTQYGHLDDDVSAMDAHFDYLTRKWRERSLLLAEKGDKPDLAVRAVGPIDLSSVTLAINTGLTGTVTVTEASTAVVGAGTLFTTELAGFAVVAIQGVSFAFAIVDDTHLTLTTPWLGVTTTGLTVQKNVPINWTLTNGSSLATADLDINQIRVSNALTPGMGFDVMSGATVIGNVRMLAVEAVGTGTSRIRFHQVWGGAPGTYTLRHTPGSYSGAPEAWPETYATGSLYAQPWGEEARSVVAASSAVSLTATGGSFVTSAGQTTGRVKIDDVSSFYGGGRGSDTPTPNSPGFFHIVDASSNTWQIGYTHVDTGLNLLEGCTVLAIPPVYSAGGVFGGAGDATAHTAAVGAAVHTRARVGGFLNPNQNEGPADQFNGGRRGSQQKAASIEPHLAEVPTDYQRGTEWRFLTTLYGSLAQAELLRLRADGKVAIAANDLLCDFTGVFARTRSNGAKGVLVGEAGPSGEAGIALGMGFGYSGTVTLLSHSPDLIGINTKFLTELAVLPQTVYIRGIAYTISAVADDLHATMSVPFKGSGVGGQTMFRTPDTQVYVSTRTSSPPGTVDTDGSVNVVGTSTKFMTLAPGMQITIGSKLTGTIALTYGSPTVVGTGTSFIAALAGVDSITIQGVKYTSDRFVVVDNTHITLDSPWLGITVSGVPIQKPGTQRNILIITDDTHLTLSSTAPTATGLSYTITRHELRLNAPFTITSSTGSKDAITFASSNPGIGLQWGIGHTLTGETAWRLVSNRQLQALDGHVTKIKTGPLTDADYGAAPLDGTLAVDTTNGLFQYRAGGSFKTAVETADSRLYAGYARQQLKRTGAIRETITRDLVAANLTTTISGSMLITAIIALAGDVVQGITWLSGATAGSGNTIQYFALYDSAGNLLKQTVDNGATAWTASTEKALLWLGGGNYTIPADGFYYLAKTIVSGTIPTDRGQNIDVSVAGFAPILTATGPTGLTTGIAPPTITIGAARAGRPYAYLY